MNEEEKLDEEIRVEKINRKYLYVGTKADKKKRLKWWEETSAKSISTISQKYGKKLNK